MLDSLRRHAWLLVAVAAALLLSLLALYSPDRQKGLAEYQASAMRPFPWGNCRARGSVVWCDQARVDRPEDLIVSRRGRSAGWPTMS